MLETISTVRAADLVSNADPETRKKRGPSQFAWVLVNLTRYGGGNVWVPSWVPSRS